MKERERSVVRMCCSVVVSQLRVICPVTSQSLLSSFAETFLGQHHCCFRLNFNSDGCDLIGRRLLGRSYPTPSSPTTKRLSLCVLPIRQGITFHSGQATPGLPQSRYHYRQRNHRRRMSTSSSDNPSVQSSSTTRINANRRYSISLKLPGQQQHQSLTFRFQEAKQSDVDIIEEQL